MRPCADAGTDSRERQIKRWEEYAQIRVAYSQCKIQNLPLNPWRTCTVVGVDQEGGRLHRRLDPGGLRGAVCAHAVLAWPGFEHCLLQPHTPVVANTSTTFS